MRAALLLVTLAGCDVLVGIGDPYQDARPGTGGGDGSGSSDLLARFPFENDYVNQVTSVAASCTACPPFAAGRPSHGQAIDLDGTTHCLSFPISNPTSFTISMWVYDRTDTPYSLIAMPVAGTDHDTWQLRTDSNTTLIFMTWDNSMDRPIATPSGFAVNTWEHFAATFSATDKRLFINGAPVAFTSAQPTVTYNGSTALIGCDNDGSLSYFFSGMIDDVMIWNRALSDPEIMDLYNGG